MSAPCRLKQILTSCIQFSRYQCIVPSTTRCFGSSYLSRTRFSVPQLFRDLSLSRLDYNKQFRTKKDDRNIDRTESVVKFRRTIKILTQGKERRSRKMCARQIAFAVFIAGFVGLSSEREHKVHNIVLYPEKHSWCQITPIQQIIASPGYESVTIDNNVCVGACYSYSIPKTQPAEPGELIGPYCDSCQPSEIKCYHVNLRQIDKIPDATKILQKRVQIITNCSCQSCDKVRTEDCEITNGNTLELPQNLFTVDKNTNKSYSEEIPDLLERNNSQTLPLTTENDIKKQKYKKWFESHQNEIERTYSSDLYRLFLKQNRDNNIKIEDGDLSNIDNLPLNFGSEGAPPGLKGNYIGIGIPPRPAVDEDYDNDEDTSSEESRTHPNDVVVLPSLETKHHDVKSGEMNGLKISKNIHQGHHHVGEEELIGMNVVHMIKGPHGSLVAAPVEAKLEIDSDALRPNSEGVVIDYGTPVTKAQSKVAELFEN